MVNHWLSNGRRLLSNDELHLAINFITFELTQAEIQMLQIQLGIERGSCGGFTLRNPSMSRHVYLQVMQELTQELWYRGL